MIVNNFFDWGVCLSSCEFEQLARACKDCNVLAYDKKGTYQLVIKSTKNDTAVQVSLSTSGGSIVHSCSYHLADIVKPDFCKSDWDMDRDIKRSLVKILKAIQVLNPVPSRIVVDVNFNFRNHESAEKMQIFN